MQIQLDFEKKPLQLPKRFEALEREIKSKNVDLSHVVVKVDSAILEIEKLISQIQIGKLGIFKLFLGKSGSGKTTFIKTLPAFFDNIEVYQIENSLTLNQIPDFIKSRVSNKQKIFILYDRDNPLIDEKELKIFFEELRKLFRSEEGNVLILWPITDEDSAKVISEIAWSIGRDSLVSSEGAIYTFTGIPKGKYYETANITVQNLNNGENLETFGITNDNVAEILSSSETIGQFYSQVELKSFELNRKSWNILEQKIIPKIWIILTGDDTTELDRTVRTLTQGTKNKLDIERICEFLDDTNNQSIYLNKWRQRRDSIAYILRLLDVRLYELIPNATLAAIRNFCPVSITDKLNKKSESEKVCRDQIKRTKIYQELTNQHDVSRRMERATSGETANEFLRIQQLAADNDKELNKGFASALEKYLKEDGFVGFKIISEKQDLSGTQLKPDIQIKIDDNHVICLEFTWRSTGSNVPNEIEKKQNTLTPGHIQKYVLEKVMEYVESFGL